jgi:hypothetical protein
MRPFGKPCFTLSLLSCGQLLTMLRRWIGQIAKTLRSKAISQKVRAEK